MKHTELSEKELKTYNIKLKNSYYYDNSFDNEDNSFNLINSLEKREALYSYFFSKIDFLKKELNFLEIIEKEIKKKLINKFGSYSLSEEAISVLNNDILSLIPIYDEDLSKTQNEIVFEALSYDLENKLYNQLKITDKDDYETGIKTLKKIEQEKLKYSLSIELLEEELLKVKPIEIKNGFYLFENLNDYHLLSTSIFKEEESGINCYNSIFIGENQLDKLLNESENQLFNSKNLNSVANIIPELEYDSNLEQKKFIAINGMGGRKGGLFEKEIIASCKEEALLKLNKWAKENKSRSWSIYKMTQPCSSGLINIYEEQDKTIR